MWVALPNSFLSIVALQTALSGPQLLVRARAAGDIEPVFSQATVAHTPDADYAYRTTLSRTAVARGLAATVAAITYPNFKNAVPERDRHDAYLGGLARPCTTSSRHAQRSSDANLVGNRRSRRLPDIAHTDTKEARMGGFMARIPTGAGTLAFVITLAGAASAAEPPASVQQIRNDIVVQEDGTAVQTMHIETAVHNDDAARAEAQQPMAFSDGLERVELVNAYTQKPDGKRIPVRPDAVRTQLAPGVPNVPAYNDNKVVTAVMPDVAGGDLLVTNWRRTITHPLVPGEFAFTSLFPRAIPWDDAEVTISTPLDKPLQVETHGPSFEQADENGRHVYHWHYSARAVAEDFAALLPIDRVPRIFASTFADWPAFSRSYAGQFAPAVTVTPRIQALADTVTAGITNRRNQARHLYEWVEQHERWVAIYLGNGTIVPHTADEVLANGYGDCKDQAALFAALLRAKGISAEPVLINLGPTYTLSQPVTYSAFNHVITYLPEFQIYADTTSGAAPFGTVPLFEYGKPILHVTSGGDAPSRLPTLAVGAASDRLHTLTTLAADGSVTGTSLSEGVGPYSTALRFSVKASRAQGAEQFGAALLSRSNQSGQGSITPPPTDLMNVDYQVPGSFRLEPQQGWLDGNTFWLPTGMQLLTRNGDGLIGPVRNRRLPPSESTPCYAGEQEEELSLILPSGRRPARLPKNISVHGSFFQYDSNWSFVGNKITVHRKLVSTIAQPLCEGAQRAEAATALTMIRRDLDAEVGLEPLD